MKNSFASQLLSGETFGITPNYSKMDSKQLLKKLANPKDNDLISAIINILVKRNIDISDYIAVNETAENITDSVVTSFENVTEKIEVITDVKVENVEIAADEIVESTEQTKFYKLDCAECNGFIIGETVSFMNKTERHAIAKQTETTAEIVYFRQKAKNGFLYAVLVNADGVKMMKRINALNKI